MNENELIRRARDGDGSAWESLLREHQDAVFRLAYLMLGDADEAEDVAQDAFIRAFSSLHSFDVGRPIRPWLLTIAANLARNQRRTVSRYLAALRRAFQTTPQSITYVETYSAQHSDAETLWQAVGRLSLSDQQIIYLRYFLELSEAESASTLNIAVGTAKSRLHRALGRLKAVVEREFPGLREVRDV